MIYYNIEIKTKKDLQMLRKLPNTTVDILINDIQNSYLKNNAVAVYKFEGSLTGGATFKGTIRRTKKMFSVDNDKSLILAQPPILTDFIVNENSIISDIMQFETEEILLNFLRENLDDDFAEYTRTNNQIRLDGLETALFQTSIGCTPKGFSSSTFSFRIQEFDPNVFLNKYKEILYVAHTYLGINILGDTSELVRELNGRLYSLIVSMSDSTFVNKLIDIKFAKIEKTFSNEKFNLNKLLFLTYIDILRNLRTFYITPGAQKTTNYYIMNLEWMQNWA